MGICTGGNFPSENTIRTEDIKMALSREKRAVMCLHPWIRLPWDSTSQNPLLWTLAPLSSGCLQTDFSPPSLPSSPSFLFIRSSQNVPSPQLGLHLLFCSLYLICVAVFVLERRPLLSVR